MGKKAQKTRAARQSAAKLKLGTASPPETPIASPVANRKTSIEDKGPFLSKTRRRRQPPPLPLDHGLAPHHHSHANNVRVAHPAVVPSLSTTSGPMSTPYRYPRPPAPQPSPSDSDDEESADDDTMDPSLSSGKTDSESDSPSSLGSHQPITGSRPSPRVVTTHGRAAFEIEELSDFDAMDSDREAALKPAEYEYPESERSRSPACYPAEGSRGPYRARAPELSREFVNSMRNLDCDDSDDEFDADDREHHDFVVRQKELKRIHRISHGSSIGKRTMSDRGDSDHEDLKPFENGENALHDRRMRRRVGERRESIFYDHPPERIPELEEPDSDAEEQEFNFARELPYYDIEIMEVDSE